MDFALFDQQMWENWLFPQKTLASGRNNRKARKKRTRLRILIWTMPDKQPLKTGNIWNMALSWFV
jgi:hypothetical protein